MRISHFLPRKLSGPAALRAVGLPRALAPKGHRIRLNAATGQQDPPDPTTAALLDGNAEVVVVKPQAWHATD